MPKYQVLYWQELPAQIKIEDGLEELNIELDERFQDLIEAAAESRGLTQEDSYLDQWKWGDLTDCEGDPAKIAEELKLKFEKEFIH